MNDQETINRSVAAEKILKSPVYLDAWERVRAAYFAAIEKSPARDPEGREFLYQQLKALNDVRAAFEETLNAGKVVIKRLEEKRRWYELRKVR